MIVVVTGGRHFNDRDLLFEAMDSVPVGLLIEGGATGADRLARAWAKERGIEWKTEKAKWRVLGVAGAVIRLDRYGRRYNALAGHLRNQAMLDIYKPEVCVAFPGGTGTAHMVSCCERCNVPVIRIRAKAVLKTPSIREG